MSTEQVVDVKKKKAQAKRGRSKKSTDDKQRKLNQNRPTTDLSVADKVDASCLYCDELYSASTEPWIQCQGSCQMWGNILCAGMTDIDTSFICELCQ